MEATSMQLTFDSELRSGHQTDYTCIKNSIMVIYFLDSYTSFFLCFSINMNSLFNKGLDKTS